MFDLSAIQNVEVTPAFYKFTKLIETINSSAKFYFYL